jgi:hypothetical protein
MIDHLIVRREQVYLPDLSYEEISEEINYGVIPLLCDFGGTLGLLLGASGDSNNS